MRKPIVVLVALLALAGAACSSKNNPNAGSTTPGSNQSTGTEAPTSGGPTASGTSTSTSSGTPSPTHGALAGGFTVKATDQLTFDPKDITVKVGDIVTWQNPTSVNHTVTFTSGQSFNQPLPAGGRVVRRFLNKGTFDYKCTIHPQTMTGTVTVQ